MASPLWIDLQGAVNVRDLGGLPTTTGQTTRPGVLVRSDAVHELTEADVATLTGTIGVRHIVDLRAPGERAEQGRGRLGQSGVTYSELDVLTDEMIVERRRVREAALAAGNADVATLMADGYSQLLELGRKAFVTALERIAAPGGAPALIHCSAGKDRTGVLVALLLDAAGVERATIIADYAATEQRIALVHARLSTMPAFAELAANATAGTLNAHAATMEQFLDRLHGQSGGAEPWFRAGGASQEVLATWREKVLR